MDMDQHEGTVDVADLEGGRFSAAQTGRVQQHQQCAVQQIRCGVDKSCDLLRAEDDGQLFGRPKQRQVLEIQIASLQHPLVEEPERTHTKCDCSECQLLLVKKVQLKVANLLDPH